MALKCKYVTGYIYVYYVGDPSMTTMNVYIDNYLTTIYRCFYFFSQFATILYLNIRLIYNIRVLDTKMKCNKSRLDDKKPALLEAYVKLTKSSRLKRGRNNKTRIKDSLQGRRYKDNYPPYNSSYEKKLLI